MNKKYVILIFVFSLILASGVVYAQTNTTEDAVNNEGMVAGDIIALGERTLRIGEDGTDVAELQTILNELGYREGYIDGAFGPLTHGSVQRFQEDQELTADGVVEGETMKLLQKQQSTLTESQTALVQTTDEFNFTAAELDLFARLVHAESEGEPYEGQVAVAATILNRIRSERYPNTMSGVVYQVESGRYQYSPVLDGRINKPAGESAKRAVREALNGADPTNGSTGFFNPAKTSNAWVHSRPINYAVGSHVFFRY